MKVVRRGFELFHKMSEPQKASLAFVISNILVKGMSFFTLPIFARLLTTSEYGIVATYQTWVSVVAIFTTLTLWGGVFNVGMAKYHDNYKKMISSFQGLATTITVCTWLLAVVCMEYVTKYTGMSSFLVNCMFLEILAQSPYYLWTTEQRYNYKYKKVVVISVLSALANPFLGMVLVINSSHKAEARILSGLVISLVLGIIIFGVNHFHGRKFYDRFFWKYGFTFNITLVSHYISTQILNQSDRLMIKGICGDSDAGIYSVAYNFALIVTLITNAINYSMTPYVYKCIQNSQTKKLGEITTKIVLGVAVIALFIISFVPDLFLFLLPNEYYTALKVIPPVVMGSFFCFVAPLFSSIELYYEKKQYVNIVSIGGAILNIVLNYLFIPRFGLIAAAYTTLFCYCAFALAHYCFMKRTLKQVGVGIIFYNAKSLVLISVASLIMMFILITFYENFIARWCLIVAILTGVFFYRNQIKNIILDIGDKS